MGETDTRRDLDIGHCVPTQSGTRCMAQQVCIWTGIIQRCVSDNLQANSHGIRTWTELAPGCNGIVRRLVGRDVD